jgi:hypothetical protein
LTYPAEAELAFRPGVPPKTNLQIVQALALKGLVDGKADEKTASFNIHLLDLTA